MRRVCCLADHGQLSLQPGHCQFQWLLPIFGPAWFATDAPWAGASSDAIGGPPINCPTASCSSPQSCAPSPFHWDVQLRRCRHGWCIRPGAQQEGLWCWRKWPDIYQPHIVYQLDVVCGPHETSGYDTALIRAGTLLYSNIPSIHNIAQNTLDSRKVGVFHRISKIL